jgi:hypothetical protein
MLLIMPDTDVILTIAARNALIEQVRPRTDTQGMRLLDRRQVGA